MINILERQFDLSASTCAAGTADRCDAQAGRLANGFDKLTIKKIKERSSALLKGLGAYLKRLLFPLYLFPIKLVTYTAYYFVKFLIKFIFVFIGLIFETLVFPDGKFVTPTKILGN